MPIHWYRRIHIIRALSNNLLYVYLISPADNNRYYSALLVYVCIYVHVTTTKPQQYNSSMRLRGTQGGRFIMIAYRMIHALPLSEQFVSSCLQRSRGTIEAGPTRGQGRSLGITRTTNNLREGYQDPNELRH